MESRLAHVAGKRVGALYREDLSAVAFAITTFVRKLTPVRVSWVSISGAPVVVFESDWFVVPILREDWVKIEPYVQDDTFLPSLFPPFAGYSLLRPDAEVTPEAFSRDPLYRKVLDTLTVLFPNSYPTSDY